MILRVWKYYFKHALTNMLNNRMIYTISMGTITISMLLFGSFLLISMNLNNWLSLWGQSLSMSVYIEDGISTDMKKNIESTLLDLPGAELKEFITKNNAMDNLKQALGKQAGLLDGIKKNPLPASFEIVFPDIKDRKINAARIKEQLEAMQGIDEVQYSEQWVERFEGIMYIFRVAGLVIGSLLCVAVLFIITNTIKLAIYSRRDEIEIYKLVGATDWFVRIPFLIEGTIQGVLGGAVAFLILFLVYSVFSLKSVQIFGLPVFDIVFLTQGYALFIIGLSTLLGVVGGSIALGRFFKS